MLKFFKKTDSVVRPKPKFHFTGEMVFMRDMTGFQLFQLVLILLLVAYFFFYKLLRL